MTLPFHPLAEEYPLMPDEELTLLVEDMRDNGFDPEFPVVLLDGQILDGRNRYRAATLAGVEVITTELPSGADARLFVGRANAHRRHLTEEWRVRRRDQLRQRAAELRRQGRSTRDIAQALGIPETSVRRLLSESGVAPETGFTTGRDGRRYQSRTSAQNHPSGAPRGAPDNDPCQTQENPEPQGIAVSENPSGAPRGAPDNDPPETVETVSSSELAAAPVLRDEVGVPIYPHAQAAFAGRERFDALHRAFRDLQRQIQELALADGGQYYRRNLEHQVRGDRESWRCRHVNAGRQLLEFATPYAGVCPPCYVRHGVPGRTDPRCEACHGLGWVIENAWNRCNVEDREVVLALGLQEDDA